MMGIMGSRVPVVRSILTRSCSQYVNQEAVRPLTEIPGPTSYPIVGTAPSFFSYMKGLNDGETVTTQGYFMSLHQKYGKTVKIKSLGQNLVLLHDPDDFQHFMQKEGKWPRRNEVLAWILAREEIGEEKGVLLSDGEHWQRLRSSVNKHMMRPRSVASHTDDFRQVADDMVARLAKSRNADHVVPKIGEELFKWSFESACTMLLDRRMGVLADEVPPESMEFITTVVQALLSTENLFTVKPRVLKALRVPIWTSHVKYWETIFRIGKKYIDEALADIAAKQEKGETTEGLIASMVAADNLSQKEFNAVMLDLMAAAVDTTSNTVSFTLDVLSRRPDIQETVYNEIMSVAGAEQLTYDHIKHMPYLKAVVRECLRLYPVAPIVGRILEEDIVVDGYHVPAGTPLFAMLYTMARDPSLFPDPERFMPERWLRGQKAREDIHPYSSLPFGFGPRACIGRRVAELEAYLLISTVLRRFELKTLEEGPMRPLQRIILRQERDPLIQFMDRQ